MLPLKPRSTEIGIDLLREYVQAVAMFDDRYGLYD